MLNHCRTDGSSVLGDVTEHFVKKTQFAQSLMFLKVISLFQGEKKRKEKKINVPQTSGLFNKLK